MTIQRLKEIPAVCENEKCDDYKAFELYDTDKVKTVERRDYVICYGCNKRIYLK